MACLFEDIRKSTILGRSSWKVITGILCFPLLLERIFRLQEYYTGIAQVIKEIFEGFLKTYDIRKQVVL